VTVCVYAGERKLKPTKPFHANVDITTGKPPLQAMPTCKVKRTFITPMSIVLLNVYILYPRH